MDFLFNFKTQELTEDSLILQVEYRFTILTKKFSENGKRIHFFGDDTWLKLFPKFFNEYEGTTSFFVAVRILVIEIV